MPNDKITNATMVYRSDVAKAIELDPVATYRSYRGDEADELEKLPKHVHPGAVRFIILGIKPGSFLTAIFANEMEIAKMKADVENLEAFDRYPIFLENGCPAICWGSSENVRAWCEVKGLLGMMQRVKQ